MGAVESVNRDQSLEQQAARSPRAARRQEHPTQTPGLRASTTRTQTTHPTPRNQTPCSPWQARHKPRFPPPRQPQAPHRHKLQSAKLPLPRLPQEVQREVHPAEPWAAARPERLPSLPPRTGPRHHHRRCRSDRPPHQRRRPLPLPVPPQPQPAPASRPCPLPAPPTRQLPQHRFRSQRAAPNATPLPQQLPQVPCAATEPKTMRSNAPDTSPPHSTSA